MAQTAKIGRNDLCSCGSGKKFKKCCELKQQSSRSFMLLVGLVVVVVVGGLVAAATSFRTDNVHTAKSSGVWSPEHGHYH